MPCFQYPEFIKSPTEVNLIGVNGGKIKCEIFGVPKPKVVWYKDYAPLKETPRRQAHFYAPQTHTLFFEDYITQVLCISSITIVQWLIEDKKKLDLAHV